VAAVEPVSGESRQEALEVRAPSASRVQPMDERSRYMSDMENHLWNLANIVTGFAVAQSLAFLYALGQKEFSDAVDSPVATVIIVIATAIASVVYSTAVYLIGAQGASLADAEQEKKIWASVTWGRIVSILIFNGFVLLIVLLQSAAR
jgi:hypothetical protein